MTDTGHTQGHRTSQIINYSTSETFNMEPNALIQSKKHKLGHYKSPLTFRFRTRTCSIRMSYYKNYGFKQYAKSKEDLFYIV